MPTVSDISKPKSPRVNPVSGPPVFGVNEVRLNARQWIITFAIVALCAICVPKLWRHFEPFATGPDYRIPYPMSRDYWLYQRRLDRISDKSRIPILGDSVVWGEYVRPNGTLSHFLNQNASRKDRFVNCGVNGMFPLALEGLIEDYGTTLHDRKVIVQCNMLWMTSPKADLSATKEESFNHSRLVPQFAVKIPCYRADANERLSAVIERHVEFFQWINHLQNAYFDQKSIPQWTLVDDGNDPPKYPNAWRNPLSQLRGGVPGEPAVDPQRGPTSPRHKPWNADGADPTDFDWVKLDSSLQWQAFERVIRLLRDRHDDVLVLLGPLNEHMIAEDQLQQYRAMRDTMAASLSQSGVTVIKPAALPTNLYADASHPLTQGYSLLATQIWKTPEFQTWLKRGRVATNGHE